jgi:hypothetical protein
MIRSFGIAIVVPAALMVGATRPLWADDVPIDPAVHEAADHFERGVRLYEEQDWRAALIEFERAYSVRERYEVLYNIAQCRYQLQNYAGALTAFETYLTRGGTQIPPEQRERVQATIDDLRGRVARVLVVTDVSEAEITVDDVVVGTTPLSSPLVLSEGRRKITAKKVGHTSAFRYVDIAGKDSIEVKLLLGPGTPPEAAHAAVRRPEGGRSVAPVIAAASLAAVGIGVGTFFGITAMGDKSNLDLVCTNRACPPAAESQISTLRRNAVVSTVGFSVGVFGLGAGIAYLLFAPGRGSPGATPESGGVHPLLGPGVAGAVGSFR